MIARSRCIPLLIGLSIAGATAAGCSTDSQEVAPSASVSVDPSAARSLYTTELVSLSDVTGKSVEAAKSMLGFPNRLAGPLKTTNRVGLVSERDITEVVQLDWIVTGWCYRSGRIPSPDALTLSAVPTSVYRPGYITGESGANNFPKQWAHDRACDTNPSLMLPVEVS
jgi:hypothetical protein